MFSYRHVHRRRRRVICKRCGVKYADLPGDFRDVQRHAKKHGWDIPEENRDDAYCPHCKGIVMREAQQKFAKTMEELREKGWVRLPSTDDHN